MMRCPSCGATNPDTASWCSQCYASFDADEHVPEEVTEEVPEPVPEPTAGAAPEPATGEGQPAGTTTGFRRRGDTLEWQCPVCDAYTSVDQLTCHACGTPLAARYQRDEPGAEPNWSAALALAVVVPGAGHLAVGRFGAGLGRMAVFLVWLAGALLLTAAGGTQALPAAAPLYLGAGVLWAGSVVDVLQLRRGERELLGGRVLLWVVVGTLLLTAVGMFATAGP